MSTSDSGKGASVSEECDTPGYVTTTTNNLTNTGPVITSSMAGNKPSHGHKQVTFYNVPPSKGGGEVADDSYNGSTRSTSPQQQQHRYKGGQKMTTFSATSPITSANNSLTRPGNKPSYKNNTDVASTGSSQKNTVTPGGSVDSTAQGYKSHQAPPPYSSVTSPYGNSNYRQHNVPTGYSNYNNKYTGVGTKVRPIGGRPPVVGRGLSGDDDYVSDADTTSTMSGTYVLANDDLSSTTTVTPQHRIDFSRMKDSVV